LKRWFVLEPSDLRYYEKTGGKEKGGVKLQAATEVRASEAPNSASGELELVTPDRTYRFRAPDQRSMEVWIEEIGKAMGALAGGKSTKATAARKGSSKKKSTGNRSAPSKAPEAAAPAVRTDIVPGMTVRMIGKKKNWTVLEARDGQAHIQVEGGKMKKKVGFDQLEPAPAGGASYADVLARINLHDGFYGTENALGLWEESTGTGRDMDGEALVGQLAELLAEGCAFEDHTFPAADASIWADPSRKGNFLRGEKIEWKRPNEMMGMKHKPVVFSGTIDPDDIQQGKLGDCYLLAALAAICTSEWLIGDLIVEDFGCGGTEQGLYGVKFFSGSRWITVVVDDLFPCTHQDGQGWVPIFCRPSIGEHNSSSDELELWAMIVEKAWAKLHGCYEVCDAGHCYDACKYLTGGDVIKLDADDGPEFFDSVVGELKKQSYVSTSVRGNISAADAKSAGLVAGHAYALLHAITTSKGLKLLMLKNPHGGGIEWNGAYSDGHSSWNSALQKEVDKLTRSKLGTKPRDDGSFWMSADDFKAYFAEIGACSPWGHGSTLCAAEMKLAAGQSSGGPPGFGLFQYNPVVEIRSALPQTVLVSLSQSDIRGTGTNVWPLILLYLQEEGKAPAKIIALSQRTEAVELKLRPRKPVKLITTAWKPGYEGMAFVSVTSQKALSLERESMAAPPAKGSAEAKAMARIDEPPTCYMTKKPIDYSQPHYITTHGFVFKDAHAEYEQMSATKCARCGKACVGSSIRNKKTGQEFCRMECAQAGASNE
jgi:hypothetical protein